MCSLSPSLLPSIIFLVLFFCFFGENISDAVPIEQQLMQSDSGHHHSFRQFEAGNADNGVWFNENANKKHPGSMREKRGFPADFEHQRNQFRADFQEAKLENEEQVDSFHKWIIPIAIVGILLMIFVPMCIGICVLLVLRKKN